MFCVFGGGQPIIVCTLVTEAMSTSYNDSDSCENCKCNIPFVSVHLLVRFLFYNGSQSQFLKSRLCKLCILWKQSAFSILQSLDVSLIVYRENVTCLCWQ